MDLDEYSACVIYCGLDQNVKALINIFFLEISHKIVNSKELGLSISKFFNSLWTPMADEFQFLWPEAGLKTEIKTNSAS